MINNNKIYNLYVADDILKIYTVVSLILTNQFKLKSNLIIIEQKIPKIRIIIENKLSLNKDLFKVIIVKRLVIILY